MILFSPCYGKQPRPFLIFLFLFFSFLAFSLSFLSLFFFFLHFLFPLYRRTCVGMIRLPAQSLAEVQAERNMTVALITFFTELSRERERERKGLPNYFLSFFKSALSLLTLAFMSCISRSYLVLFLLSFPSRTHRTVLPHPLR